MISEIITFKIQKEFLKEGRAVISKYFSNSEFFSEAVHVSCRELEYPKFSFYTETFWKNISSLENYKNSNEWQSFFGEISDYLSAPPLFTQNEVPSIGLDGCGG